MKKIEGAPLTNGTGNPSVEEQLEALSKSGEPLKADENKKRSKVEVVSRGYDHEKALGIARGVLEENGESANIGMVKEKLNEEGITAEFSLATKLFREAREMMGEESDSAESGDSEEMENRGEEKILSDDGGGSKEHQKKPPIAVDRLREQNDEHIAQVAREIIEAVKKRGVPLSVSKNLRTALRAYGFSEKEIKESKPEDLIKELAKKIGYKVDETIAEKSSDVSSEKELDSERAEEEDSSDISKKEEKSSEEKKEESGIPTEEEVFKEISKVKSIDDFIETLSRWREVPSSKGGTPTKQMIDQLRYFNETFPYQAPEARQGFLFLFIRDNKSLFTSKGGIRDKFYEILNKNELEELEDGRRDEVPKKEEKKESKKMEAEVEEKKEGKVEDDKKTEEAIEELVKSPDFREEVENVAEEAGIEGGIDKTKWEKIKETMKRFGAVTLSHWKKNWRELGAGAAVGMAARTAIRLSFGSSLGLGAVAGALGGALSGGVRELYTQKRTFSSEGIVKQLKKSEALSPTEQAALLAKAKEAYKKARISGSEEETAELANVIRVKEVVMWATEAKTEDASEKGKIEALLKIAKGARKELPKTGRKEAQKLIDEIRLERKEIDRKKIARAAVRGALFGAVGGTIAGALTHVLFPPSGAGVEMAQEVTEQKIKLAVSYDAQVAAEVVKESLQKSQEKLTDKVFHVTVEKGDGLTHLARRAIHDYLVEGKKLDPESFKGLSVEQLVHAEDTLVKKVTEELTNVENNASLDIGEEFTFKGREIEEIISSSSALSPEKIENIKQILGNPEHTLSGQTRSVMTDWDRVFSESNEFHKEALREAKEAAQATIEASSTIPVESVEVSPGADALLENACYEEPVEGFGESAHVSVAKNIEAQSKFEFLRPRRWGAFDWEDLDSEDAFLEKVRESSDWSVDKKISAIGELQEHVNNFPDDSYVKDFIDEKKGELLGAVSSPRYEIPAESLLEKEQYIEQAGKELGKSDPNFAKQITDALRKNPSYAQSLDRFKGIIESTGVTDGDFSKVASQDADQFIKKYGGENIRFWARVGLSEEQVRSFQKLASAMKKMVGDGTVGGKKVNVAEFTVDKLIKFFS